MLQESYRYISPDCPEGLRERIITKFGINVPLVDVINHDKLCVNLFKGFDFTVGQKFYIFPIGNTSPLSSACLFSQTTPATSIYNYPITASLMLVIGDTDGWNSNTLSTLA